MTQATALLSLFLFAIGLGGLLARRNVLIMFLCLELMLGSVNLLFVSFASLHPGPVGETLVLFVIAFAACEVGLGLALILRLYQLTGTVDADEFRELRG